MTKRQLKKWRQRRQQRKTYVKARNRAQQNTSRPTIAPEIQSLRAVGAAFRRLALRKSVFVQLIIGVGLLTGCTPY